MADQTGLGERGLALYDALSGTDTARNALALEAARTADRLDELDRIIQGEGVLGLMQFKVLDREMTDGVVALDVQVSFQNALSEARQQQMAFSNLLKALGAEGAPAAAAPAAPVATGQTRLDELRAARNRGGV